MNDLEFAKENARLTSKVIQKHSLDTAISAETTVIVFADRKVTIDEVMAIIEEEELPILSGDLAQFGNVVMIDLARNLQ
jgi:hypothetical protein